MASETYAQAAAPLLDALHELIAVVRNQRADAWIDINDVAEYLGFSVEHVRQQFVPQPDFPKPARPNGRGHPRWLRSEVAAWMRGQQI